MSPLPLSALTSEAPTRVLNADLALRYCVAAFGHPRAGQAGEAPWSELGLDLQARMASIRDETREVEPDEALGILRASHLAQAHVDPARVHPSWLARASHDESPSVKRQLADDDRTRGVDPRVAGWVRALGTERLVGGEPVADNDPPVIAALAGLPLRQVHRLVRSLGAAKLALLEQPGDMETCRQTEAVRRDWYRRRLLTQLDVSETVLRQWAEREVQRSSAYESKPGQRRPLLGLMSLARLLSDCEAFRVRWALQHLPYPVAKRLRAFISSSLRMQPQLLRIEECLLKTAWERLTLDHRVTMRFPSDRPSPSDAP